MPSSPPRALRRSSRERRPATTVYTEAAARVKDDKPKRRSIPQEVMEEQSRVSRASGHYAPELDTEDAMSDDSDSDEEEETTSASSRSTQPKRKRKAPAKTSAWALLFRNYLTKNETVDNSLLVALSQMGPHRKRGPHPGLQTLTRQLVQEHAEDANAVHVRLYNLVFRVCGASHAAVLPNDADLESLTDEELTDNITAIVQSMQYTAASEVLWTSAPPKNATKLQFRHLFQEFWHALGTAALETTVAPDDDASDSEPETQETALTGVSASPRFQVETVRSLVNRLVEMCFLQQQDLRSAMTSALYSLGTAILEKTVVLQEKLKTAERQLHAAKRHKQRRKADMLQAAVDTEKRQLQDLEDIVQESVGAVFMKRYKDVDAHIRAASMVALADFCVTRPDMFFDKRFLKYPGWTLNDKEAVVREAALTVFLQPLKAQVHDDHTLQGVAEKFAPRLADCTIDVDENVQNRAMELLLLLNRNGLLDDNDGDTVLDEATWDQINLRAIDPLTAPKARVWALLFVIEQLGAFDDEQADSDASAVERLNQLGSWVANKLGEGEIPLDRMMFERAALVIHSLRACPEYESLARNFGALIRAFESSLTTTSAGSTPRERILVDAKQRVLLVFLLTAVEEEASLSDADRLMDVDLVDDSPKLKRRKLTDREGMTRVLLPAVSNLITSFKSEVGILQRLAKLPLFFSPATCGNADQKVNVKKMLKTLSNCFMESSDQQVLQNCCHSLCFLAHASHSRQDDALAVMRDVFGALQERFSELTEKKDKLDSDDESDDEIEESDIEKIDHSISLVLRRMAILSKRWPLVDLLDGDSKEDEIEIDKLCDQVFEFTKNELDRRQPVSSNDAMRLPSIWKKTSKSHEYVVDSTQACLDILLSTAGWTVRKVEAELDDHLDSDDDSSHASTVEDDEENPLIVVRRRIEVIISLCFEQFMLDIDNQSEDFRNFSHNIQTMGGRASGDLRTLFPRAWENSIHPLLRKAALVDDHTLVGGSVRYLRQQSKKVAEDPLVAHDVLLPMGRGLTMNWGTGNRKEGASVLAHIANGAVSYDIAHTMSSKMIKIAPVRVLEAHMACLRSEFEAWATSEPAEPESDNPTEEENAKFEAEEKEHEAKFATLENLTRNLVQTITGKIKDVGFKNGVLGFIREGMRFAFSRDDPESDEELVLGARLLFLRLLAKYLTLVKNNKAALNIIRLQLNHLEEAVRSDPDFDNVLEIDIDAISIFRNAGKFGEFVEDDTTVGGHSHAASSFASSRASGVFRRRLSQGGSISSVPSKASTQGSLSPLPEERDGETEDDADSNAGTPASKSTLGSRIFSPASKTSVGSDF